MPVHAFAGLQDRGHFFSFMGQKKSGYPEGHPLTVIKYANLRAAFSEN